MATIPKRGRNSKSGRIDKSVLAIGVAPRSGARIETSLAIRENPRIVNPAFRASARGRVCDVMGCGRQDDSVVGAHLRISLPGMPGAIGAKPSDSLLLFLCHECHSTIDRRVPVSAEEYINFLLRIIAGFTARRELAFRRAQSAKARTIPLLSGKKLPGFCC